MTFFHPSTTWACRWDLLEIGFSVMSRRCNHRDSLEIELGFPSHPISGRLSTTARQSLGRIGGFDFCKAGWLSQTPLRKFGTLFGTCETLETMGATVIVIAQKLKLYTARDVRPAIATRVCNLSSCLCN